MAFSCTLGSIGVAAGLQARKPIFLATEEYIVFEIE